MPSKYSGQITVKATQSRSERICILCGRVIKPHEAHYRETLMDPGVNFIGKRFCAKCYVDGKSGRGPLDKF